MSIKQNVTQSGHFAALDSLRGVCAILVVLFHFPVSGLMHSTPVVRHGWMFVDFFFVLSGFVISHAYTEKFRRGEVTVTRFIALRLGRVYPLHVFVLAVMIALETVRFLTTDGSGSFTRYHSVGAIFTNLLLLQSMGVHPFNTWNGISWSIAAEVWAYVLFAVTLGHSPRAGPWLISIAALACAVVLLRFSPNGLDATYDYGFARAILGFSIGAGVWRAYKSGFAPKGTGLEVLSCLLVVTATARWNSGADAFLVLPVFALTVLVFASEQGAISGLLRLQAPRHIGKVSFSIYLVHPLVLLGWFGLLRKLQDRLGIVFRSDGQISAPYVLGDLVCLLMVLSVVALASLTFVMVEVPARNWVRVRIQPVAS